MHCVFLVTLVALALFTYAQTPTNIPLSTLTVENLGFVTDPVSNPGIYHDGGGGATQNGYHVQVFADSATDSDGLNFVHNSIAYFGFRDPTNPLNDYSFGMSGLSGLATFTGTVPVGPLAANESALGSNFSVWMLNGMTPMYDGMSILGVFPCLNEGTLEELYTTMVQIEVVDPESVLPGGFPPTTRLGSGRLFYPGEVFYGCFAISADLDGYLYLMGSDNTGVKLARVPDTNTTIADRSHYSYYNAATGEWQNELLLLNNAKGNILNWNINPEGKQLGPSTGDIWYDHYHQTTMMIFGDAFVDGTFWVSYATTNSLTGPWSEPVAIWTPEVPDQCKETPDPWNYQSHAHPGWDPSGETLLISYASCAEFVSMALITWAKSDLTAPNDPSPTHSSSPDPTFSTSPLPTSGTTDSGDPALSTPKSSGSKPPLLISRLISHLFWIILLSGFSSVVFIDL